MDNALAGTLQMFQSRAVPWGGINRGPKRQQLKTFKLFTISKANGRRNRPDLHHFPGNRPAPNQKLVASHSEYAYFGTSTFASRFPTVTWRRSGISIRHCRRGRPEMVNPVRT